MSDFVCVACNTGKALLPESIGAQLCKVCYLDNGQSNNTNGCSANVEAPPKVEVLIEPKDVDVELAEKVVQPKKKMELPHEKKEVARWTRLRTKTAMGPPPPPPMPKKTRQKRKLPAPTPSPVVSGVGRRTLFKSIPRKSPSNTATIVTSDQVYYEGRLMCAGDIVSMIDEEGDTYYAQIRSFLTDAYLEKSAVVTWLLPTKASPPPSECFDATTYIIGPEEDLPRKLSYMEYVMHVDINYYKMASPYPTMESERIENATGGFIWSSLLPVDRQ